MPNGLQIKTGMSLLLKLPKGKINSKKLGYVQPDGVINFQTAEVAENYAKNRCVSALNVKKPFEKGVLVNDNQILAEFEGNKDIIKIPEEYAGKIAGMSFFHGHLDSIPVSLLDYFVMMEQRLKKIVAFNKNGEHSTLIQKPKKSLFVKFLPASLQEKLIPYEQIGYGNIATSEYAKEYSKIFPEELQEKMEQALHVKIGAPYGSKKKIDKFIPFSISELNKMIFVECRALMDGTFAKTIHNFLKKTSGKLNCIYETNFSNVMK